MHAACGPADVSFVAGVKLRQGNVLPGDAVSGIGLVRYVLSRPAIVACARLVVPEERASREAVIVEL